MIGAMVNGMAAANPLKTLATGKSGAIAECGIPATVAGETHRLPAPLTGREWRQS
jgi:hypothetical protein